MTVSCIYLNYCLFSTLANTPIKKLHQKQQQNQAHSVQNNQPQTAELIEGLQELVLETNQNNQQQ